MSLKQVELVRRRATSGWANELTRLRVWLSTIDGNNDAVERLRGTSGQELLAVLVENTLGHLGHDTALSASAESAHKRSQAGKAARRFA